jgi:hypothetical protein
MALALALVLTIPSIQLEAAPAEKTLLRVSVADEAGLEELILSGATIYSRLESEAGPIFLVGADPAEAAGLLDGPLDVTRLDIEADGKAYYIVYRMPGYRGLDLSAYGRVLHEDAFQAVMQMDPRGAGRLAEAGAELRAVTTDPKPVAALRPGGGQAYELTGPAAITADPLIQQMVDAVDSATVFNYTGDLSGEWPVTVGGLPFTIATRHTNSGAFIRKATQFVGEHFDALGLAVEYHNWTDPDYPNVIAELPGTGSPDSIVILCAHLDDMPSGSLAPGADDNASGSVAVMVAADILSGYEWHYTIRFALWTGEEQGLLGSHAYALRSYNLGEDIIGVFNLDMIAYNTIGSNPQMELHENPSVPGTQLLSQIFADAISAYNLDLTTQIIPMGIGASDHASFTDYGYSAILGIEDLSDFNPNYHTTEDLLEYLDMDFYVEFVKASVAATAHLAEVESQPSPVPSLMITALLTLGLLLILLAWRAIGTRRAAG